MSSLREFVALLDVDQAASGRFIGGSDAGERGIIDGSQVLAQSLVASAKTVDGYSVRSARATFLRTIAAAVPLEFDVEVLKSGRLLAFAEVICRQGERVSVRTQVMLDHLQPDFVRHAAAPASAAGADDARVRDMPMDGRELRLDGIDDENDPDEVGPPAIRAWLRYDDVPARDDLRKALLAHFTGHLGIATSLRAHTGVGTAQSHKTISTAPLTIGISFHEPVAWDKWLLYEHDSTFAGNGMAYVRGQVFDDGRLIASFTQDAMIRSLRDDEMQIGEATRL